MKKEGRKICRHFSRFRTFKPGLTTEDNASRFRQRVGSQSLHGGHLNQEYIYFKYIGTVYRFKKYRYLIKFLASVVNIRLLFFRGYGTSTVKLVSTVPGTVLILP